MREAGRQEGKGGREGGGKGEGRRVKQKIEKIRVRTRGAGEEGE